jgi:hypothetical protein
LLALLTKFEDLFDRTLGKWNEEPVKLELKGGAAPSIKATVVSVLTIA